MEFSISKIYRDAFGYEMPGEFTIPTAADKLDNSSLGSQYYQSDALGREFFLPVTIDGYLIPFAVVSVTEKKTIVSTPMPERGGTVKELISIDDYEINIKGILLQETFPEKEMRQVHDLFLQNRSLSIRSVITDIFLKGEYEHKAVIKSINWPAVSGVEHAKPFEISMESDMIFVLDAGDLTGPVNIGI